MEEVALLPATLLSKCPLLELGQAQSGFPRWVARIQVQRQLLSILYYFCCKVIHTERRSVREENLPSDDSFARWL